MRPTDGPLTGRPAPRFTPVLRSVPGRVRGRSPDYDRITKPNDDRRISPRARKRLFAFPVEPGSRHEGVDRASPVPAHAHSGCTARRAFRRVRSAGRGVLRQNRKSHRSEILAGSGPEPRSGDLSGGTAGCGRARPHLGGCGRRQPEACPRPSRAAATHPRVYGTASGKALGTDCLWGTPAFRLPELIRPLPCIMARSLRRQPCPTAPVSTSTI